MVRHLKFAIDEIIADLKDKDVDLIVGPEARGFLMGTPVAYGMGVGFVPVRKPGKLPWEVESFEYDLEYGSNILEIHKDAIKPGQRVAIVDDLLATGGTMEAAAETNRKIRWRSSFNAIFNRIRRFRWKRKINKIQC